MKLRGDKIDKPLTLKLANGKEKSFRNGAETHEWYIKNRDFHQSRKKKRSKRGSSNKQ